MKQILIVVSLLLPLVVQAEGPRFMVGVRVSAPPPAVRFETPPPAPSRRHQWIPGFWGAREGKHVWLDGHWAIPPQSGYVWEPARWENGASGWMFYDGYWHAPDEPRSDEAYQPPAPPVQETVVEQSPPDPIVETPPAPPFAGALWIPGYWHWAGARFVWVAGRYSAQPPGYGWQRNHWDRRDDRHWVARPGHWDHHDDEHDRGHDHH